MKQDLIGSEYVDTTIDWDTGQDTRKFFKKHKKAQGPGWYYRDKNITYVYNKNGFRCKEFANLDWENSIVVMGCSQTLGTGNAVEDTIPAMLEQIIDMPVINLGISGSAIDHMCWNSMCLHEEYPTPKALCHIWTSTSRYTNFLDVYSKDEHTYEVFGEQLRPSNMHVNSKHYNGATYDHRHAWEIRSKWYVKGDRIMWRDKLPYVESTFFARSATDLGVPYIEQFDVARDLDHPGIKSNRAMAQLMASELKKKGL